MKVRPEDRKYLTLSTPKGLYRSTRLMYGIASAPTIWQREFENILKDIPGVSVFLDDIKITGPDDNTHFERLELVFERLQKYNIRVNYEKCQFFTNQIEYCGYIIDKHGIHKTKAKMEAICNARTPSNKTEVRAFVGCQKAFKKIKDEIRSDRVLAHFDPTLPLVLATDASPYAVGARKKQEWYGKDEVAREKTLDIVGGPEFLMTLKNYVKIVLIVV
ncbi:RNase H-like domain found in reverse transcriptase [Popillia japonica]|uniref:RNase H-like domain found in reverse transcriptase n=1 Tax=Popillia japonica TaxID=7064 RepID=A0AAW1IA68_POPJA